MQVGRVGRARLSGKSYMAFVAFDNGLRSCINSCDRASNDVV